MLDGKSQSVNADFVAQTLLLSDELHVSEIYAASLLQEGIIASARWGRTPTEVACLLFYRERLALLASLKELVRGTYTQTVGGDLRTGIRLGRMLDELLQGDVLVREMLHEMEQLASERERVKASMQRPSGQTRLGDDIQMERHTWITQAEQELCHTVYLLALARRISPAAMSHLLAHLSKMSLPPPSASLPAWPLYLLTSAMTVLDPTPDEAGAWLAQQSAGATVYTSEVLRTDVAFMKSVAQSLTSGTWTTPGLQHILQVQWALFGTDALSAQAALAPSLNTSMEALQTLAHQALTAEGEASALVFTILAWLGFRRSPEEELEEPAPLIDPEFQEYVLQQAEHWLLGLTNIFLPLLRKMQRSEEEAAFASTRTARAGSAVPARRYDIEALFDAIALLCRHRPESGLPFWLGADRRISRFLLWAIDTRETGQQRALFAMLAALSEGEQCAAYTHALLEHDSSTGNDRSLVAWSRLFEWLAHYIEAFQRHTSAVMPPEEMVLLRGFLHVLASVVRHSVTTRDALFMHKEYAPLDRLFGLYACAVPMDLKAALLEALTAFAAHRDGATSARVLQSLWDRLEQTGAIRRVRGEMPRAVYELEQVEAVHGRYPGTYQLITFLQAVLPYATPAAQAEALVAHMHGQGALPASHPFTTSGAAPYLAFVLDDVFLPAAKRTYARATERWSLSAACIELMDACLASFALAPKDAKESLAKHPGFDVVRRLLSGKSLLQELFFFLHPDPSLAGYEVIEQNRAQTPDFARAVKGVMRILLRILEIQPHVLQTLLPAWSDALVGERSAFVPLDLHLLQSPTTVVQVALYLQSTDPDLAWLAVQLLNALARTATFQATDAFGPLRARTSMNRLVGILEMTEEAARVTNGALAWLEAEPDDDMDVPVSRDPLSTRATSARVQAALLDLLATLTQPHVPAPNLAHLLLGFDMQAPAQDRLVDGTRDAMLQAIRTRVDPPGRWPAVLAERCYAVLHHLCVHAYTSAATLRFLRTHDFVTHMLERVALRPVAAEDDHVLPPAKAWTSMSLSRRGTLVWASGDSMSVSAEATLAWMQSLAHILSLTALELHTLAAHGQLARATPLLTLLLGEPAMQGRGAPAGRWLPCLHATHVTWDDPTSAHPPPHVARLAAAQVEDAATGPRIYDIGAVAALLLEERRQVSGPVPPSWLEQAQHTLLWAASQNTRRAISQARRAALQAWRQVLDVLMSECMSALRADVRVPLLLDVVTALLPRLDDDQDDMAVPDMAASAILHALHAVRREAEAPSDRLIPLLRALLDVICPGSSAQARSDLYLSVVCTTQLAAKNSTAARATRVRTLLATHAERLIDTAARDALDGSDVTQTVALTLLMHLASLDEAAPRLHVGQVLAQRGYLPSLAIRLQELDAPLQATLAPDPPSLNAQYVYEALMALLGRLAHIDATHIIDARILDVLARVDFPSMRPEHTWDEAEGFLPPVAERYASLLAPLLQLLVSVVTQAPQAKASVQALLLAHQDAWLAALHSPVQSSPSVADVEQAALLVHILAHVQVPAPFHTAVLALAAMYLTPDAAQVLVPQTPSERDDVSILAPTLHGLVQVAGEARRTLFADTAHAAVLRLVRALVQYLEQASTATHETRAMLVPSLHVARISEQATASRMVAAPSLGTAIAALKEQLSSMSSTLQSLDRVDGVRRDPSSVHADEWADIAAEQGCVSTSPLECRMVGEQAVERMATQLHAMADAQLDVVERLLVLLVRHLDLFTRLGPTRTSLDSQALQAEVHTVLAPILDERAAYMTVPTHLLPDAAEHATFLHMSARRVSELLLGAT